MSNILSEISLHDTIYKLKDDNAVTQEQLEEALGNIDMSEVETHVADKNNPHEVTAEQVGAATIEYVDSLTKVYAQPDEPTNPKEGDIWIDTDAAVVSYAEGESF